MSYKSRTGRRILTKLMLNARINKVNILVKCQGLGLRSSGQRSRLYTPAPNWLDLSRKECRFKHSVNCFLTNVITVSYWQEFNLAICEKKFEVSPLIKALGGIWCFTRVARAYQKGISYRENDCAILMSNISLDKFDHRNEAVVFFSTKYSYLKVWSF